MEFEKNEDGTDKLDEQGNRIPKVIDDKGKEVAKVNAQLVDEIKELRLKLGITEGLLQSKENKQPESEPNKPLTDEEKLELLLDKKLQEKAASDAKANKKAAFEKFITEHKEFNPENDPTGLKRDALQKKFDRFNTDGLSSIEEFLPVIGEAKILLLGNDVQVDTTKDIINPSSFPTPKGNPPAKQDKDLTPKELRLMAQAGTTKERILKLKATNPEYLASLLEFVRD